MANILSKDFLVYWHLKLVTVTMGYYLGNKEHKDPSPWIDCNQLQPAYIICGETAFITFPFYKT